MYFRKDQANKQTNKVCESTEMDKVVHKFCFERKMRGRVKLFKSQGETFQPLLLPFDPCQSIVDVVWYVV